MSLKFEIKVTGSNFITRWFLKRQSKQVIKNLIRSCGEDGIGEHIANYAFNSGYTCTTEGSKKIYTKGTAKITIE